MGTLQNGRVVETLIAKLRRDFDLPTRAGIEIHAIPASEWDQRVPPVELSDRYSDTEWVVISGGRSFLVDLADPARAEANAASALADDVMDDLNRSWPELSTGGCCRPASTSWVSRSGRTRLGLLARSGTCSKPSARRDCSPPFRDRVVVTGDNQPCPRPPRRHRFTIAAHHAIFGLTEPCQQFQADAEVTVPWIVTGEDPWMPDGGYDGPGQLMLVSPRDVATSPLHDGIWCRVRQSGLHAIRPETPCCPVDIDVIL
jgi:hypothetical protein